MPENNSRLTFGSLFSGIPLGGMDLGLERAGMVCRWQVEIDPFARKVLARHWPDVRRHDDVRTFPTGNPEDWRVDLICGGFPCQDISNAGKRAGIDGDRSGLWAEFARAIRHLRPRYVLVENVSALLVRGLGRVLGDLAAIGYDAEWECLPASALGAPHFRCRIFIVATARPASDPDGQRCDDSPQRHHAIRLFECLPEKTPWFPELPESAICGIGDGVSHRVDRLGALGNAVVPQVAQFIGERLIASIGGQP